MKKEVMLLATINTNLRWATVREQNLRRHM